MPILNSTIDNSTYTMSLDKALLDKTFVTSDYHFGSCKIGGIWQVFSEVQEDQLIEEWNKRVPKDGLVLYIGDFVDDAGVFARYCSYSLEQYRERLNGDIILIKGNHDTFSLDRYNKMFKTVCRHLDIENLKLSLQHEDFEETRPGYRKMFGHMHRQCQLGKLVGPDFFCTCVMRNGYVPTKLLDAIAEMDAHADNNRKDNNGKEDQIHA